MIKVEPVRYLWIGLLALLVVASCSDVDLQPAAPEPFVFAAMGDVPYTPEGREALPDQLDGIPRESAFVVHLGDIKRGFVPCDEAIYEDVSNVLRGSPLPLFIVLGDNEFNDCADQDEAFGLWKRHFNRFDAAWSHDLDVSYQDVRDENFAFVHKGTLFIGINLVGSGIRDQDEWFERLADNWAWTRDNVERHGDDVTSVVIFGHALPMSSHDSYFLSLVDLAEQFGKPMLYLHGDGHFWVHDRPFSAENIERVMVDQGDLAPPVLVTVTHDPAEPFMFDRRLGAGVVGAR